MLQLYVVVEAAIQRALPESRLETARKTWLSPARCGVGLVVSRWPPQNFAGDSPQNELSQYRPDVETNVVEET